MVRTSVQKPFVEIRDCSGIAGDVRFASESGQIADVSVGPSCADFAAYQDARDVARALGKSEALEQSRDDRKRLGCLRLRGPCGAQDEFTLAAIAQNLRRLAKLVARPPPQIAACLA
jgi:hypothetical protein